MELSPSREVTNCTAIQEILSILWNPKTHYHDQKSPPLVPILSQIGPVRTTPSYPANIHFKLSNHLCPRLPSGHFGFPNNILYAYLFSSIRSTWPAHFILIDLIILIMLGEEYKLRSSLFIQPPITSSLFSPNIFLSTVFSNLQFGFPLINCTLIFLDS
jgi:hypothetical protein